MKLTSYENRYVTLYGPQNMDGMSFYPCAIRKVHNKEGKNAWVVYKYPGKVDNTIKEEYLINTFDTEENAIVAVELLLA